MFILTKLMKNGKEEEAGMFVTVEKKQMGKKKMKKPNTKIEPKNKKGKKQLSKKLSLSYEEKKERSMDVHHSIYVKESKSNNCKRQGHSKHGMDLAKKKKKKKKRSVFAWCFGNSTDLQDEIDMQHIMMEKEKGEVYGLAHDKEDMEKVPSLTLSDYIDHLINKPANPITKTMSITDVPKIPALKRFLSYQGEFDDLLLPLVAAHAGRKEEEEDNVEKKKKDNNDHNDNNKNAETKCGDINSSSMIVHNDKVPITLYNTPEKYFNNCERKVLEELNQNKLVSIENLKVTSSYYKDFSKKKERPNPKSLKRVFREIRKDLPRALEIDAYGSMFIRYDQDAPMFMRALLSGGPNTPYADGLFLFDILCDNKYPVQNCLVKHVTKNATTLKLKHSPGGFSPNLHGSTGKVCLSLLGTWSGVGWSPNKSNIYQVLSTLMRDIFGVENPYYNEPNYGFWEGTAPKTNHKDPVDYCNAYIREATLRLAILAPLTTPIKGFERVIKLHFLAKREAIEKRMTKWLKDARDKLNFLEKNKSEAQKKYSTGIIKTRTAWLVKHIDVMKILICDVKAALLKNMNALNLSKAIDNYQCNVNHIERALKKLKHFGSLFDHSKNDKVDMKIERGGILLGIEKRKKIVDAKFIKENLSGWESKYAETVKKLEKTKLIVNKTKLKVEERRKQVLPKKKIGEEEEKKEEETNKKKDVAAVETNKKKEKEVDTHDEDEPLPAGYSTEKQWLEDVINYSKEVDGDDDDDDDNVKFGKAPTFKKS